MTPYIVLVEIKVVRNDVLNFELHDQLSRLHTTQFDKFSYLAEKIILWLTLEAPKEKTEYLPELVIVFKVV